MADLDVADIILDPDFADLTLIYTRNTQTIVNGYAVNTPATLPMFGTVTIDQGDILDRLAGAEYISGSILVHTPTVLVDGKLGLTADIVSWKGRLFTVTHVGDYSSFGSGFVWAVCAPLALSGS